MRPSDKCIDKCNASRRFYEYDFIKLPEIVKNSLNKLDGYKKVNRCSYCGVIWLEHDNKEEILGRQELGTDKMIWKVEKL